MFIKTLDRLTGKRGITLIPFITGVLYTYYKFRKLDVINIVILLIALISMEEGIEMLSGYFIKEKPETTVSGDLTAKYLNRRKEIDPKNLILAVYPVAMIALTIRSNFVVFLLMLIIFFKSITYRGGPIPMVKTHRSEVTTGVILGFLIPFTTVLVNLKNELLSLSVFQTKLLIEGNLQYIASVFLISLPLLTSLSNIILTDNIIDMELDRKQGRFTTPILLGKDIAVIILATLYAAGLISMLMSTLLKVLPPVALLMILPYSLVARNTRYFIRKTHKEKGNVLARENFLAVSSVLILVLIIGLVFRL